MQGPLVGVTNAVKHFITHEISGPRPFPLLVFTRIKNAHPLNNSQIFFKLNFFIMDFEKWSLSIF